jgi:hypothetical protein
VTDTSPRDVAAHHAAQAQASEAAGGWESDSEELPRYVALTCSDRGTHATVQLAVARDSRRSRTPWSPEHEGRITVDELRRGTGRWIRNGAKRAVARTPVTHDSSVSKRTFTLGCTRCTRRPTLSEDELGALLERLYEKMPRRRSKDDSALNHYDWSLNVSWRS